MVFSPTRSLQSLLAVASHRAKDGKVTPRSRERSGGLLSQHRAHVLAINTAHNGDPTRTLTIRRAWIAEMNKRFRALKGAINEAIIQDDILALTEPNHTPMFTLQVEPFLFATDAEKVEQFRVFLQEEMDEGILEVIERGPAGRVLEHREWQNTFIDSAYKRGLARGQAELIKAGIEISTLLPEPIFPIEAIFGRPIQAERVQLIYTRAFNELEGITDSMAQTISRSLAESLAEGRGPRQTARILNRRVDIGLQRARTLARTETIRAHHSAMIQTYRDAGVEGVIVMAEFATAGDDRVCPDCAFLEGRVFTLDEIENLIPLHPNCRCVALPANIGEKPRPQRGFTMVDRRGVVGDRFKNKDGTFRRRGFFEEKTGRTLPGQPRPGVKTKSTKPPQSELDRRNKVARKQAKARRKKAEEEGL